ncbi:uncharacterized protein LOC132307656 [Cornus florida]|uniref:uncharacterized protein LOC132307656 n=1 Tax=Cornus florida TaxID=4283 RepID=UPI00289BF0C4|nr:uncharacterized protein LOC132307656 [Cornus florida]
MKKCELCKSAARMYCDSDEANLCWDCDTRVHTANFLVAKHSRTLLCHTCQSPTPWSASGPKLVPRTVSVCQTCVNSNNNVDDDRHDLHSEDHNNEDEEEEEEEEDDDDDDDNDYDDHHHHDHDNDGDNNNNNNDGEDDGDNQVVPLSSMPLVSGDSSSEENSSSRVI